MASRDVKGVAAGKNLRKALDRARDEAEDESEQYSNIEVGDFLSELATAVRFRMKSGLSYGDWIEEPERSLTDGLIFGREEAVAADVKLQVTLSLDASTSMWVNDLMRHAGPTFLAIDRVIRKAMVDLPEGTVLYAPFVFHQNAYQIPASFLNNYVGRIDSKEERAVWPNTPTQEDIAAAIASGELSITTTREDWRSKLSGTETFIAPLFKAIADWEQKKGDPNALRLDIVITDGVLESVLDVEEATAVQEQRNGRLQTVLLNFLPLDQWDAYQLPDRCAQFPVTADSISTSIRSILQEAIEGLFH